MTEDCQCWISPSGGGKGPKKSIYLEDTWRYRLPRIRWQRLPAFCYLPDHLFNVPQLAWNPPTWHLPLRGNVRVNNSNTVMLKFRSLWVPPTMLKYCLFHLATGNWCKEGNHCEMRRLWRQRAPPSSWWAKLTGTSGCGEEVQNSGEEILYHTTPYQLLFRAS